MKRISINKDWSFTYENDLTSFNDFGFGKCTGATGGAAHFYDYSNWQRIDLPHDWAVALTKTLKANAGAGGFPNTRGNRAQAEGRSLAEDIRHIGWYRREFTLGNEYEGKRVFLELEGVFQDAAVWVNGIYMTRHIGGYNSFCFEITEQLLAGQNNSIAVRVDSDQREGWWYEGSGIYRNVNLIVGEPTYFKYNKTFVRADMNGKARVDTVVVNDTEEAVEKTVFFEILDSQGSIVAVEDCDIYIDPFSEVYIQTEMLVDEPLLWSVDEPNLYTLKLTCGDELQLERFGFRTFTFDSDKGFFLNGKFLKLRGACVHQDLGGVGVALTDNLHRYKIQRLKEMGVNAYRCSHNAPAPALLQACDELGMLVMDETRLFGTSPEALEQLVSLVERDRNHASVFIWSIGNEEFEVQQTAWSRRMADRMVRTVKSLDDSRLTTYGGNNGENFVGINGAVDVRGINYIRNGTGKDSTWIEKYHADHPNQPILGSEESSFVLSRGGAKNDQANGLIDSTGNVTMSWGSSLKGWVKFYEERDYILGGFMWTGFDYRGEPNPFYMRNVVSSFGTIDLCGMEKPPFYYYKSWWTDEAVLKLSPSWNHNVGEKVTVSAYTNCESIKLTLNGRVVAEQRVERFDAPVFELEFEPGVLEVEGIKDGKTYYDRLVTAGKTDTIKVTPILDSTDDGDISIYELEGFDRDGNPCLTAYDELELDVEGCRIVGVGNGDPSNLDYEQKLPEERSFLITALACEDGVYTIPDKAGNVKSKRYDWLLSPQKDDGFEDDYRIVAMYAYNRTPAKNYEYTAIIKGAEKYEYIEFERLGGNVTVYLNGEKIGHNYASPMTIKSDKYNRPYRFYCSFKEGDNELKIVASRNETDFEAVSGYVKVGRYIDTPWRVKLHYGRARVFVKRNANEDVKIEAKIVE